MKNILNTHTQLLEKRQSIRGLINKKLPARSLFFAIMVVLMIGLISGALITLSYLQRTRLDHNLLNQKVIRNAQSGFNLLLGTEDTLTATIDLFNNGKDSVFIKKQYWGLYNILYAKTFQTINHRQYQSVKSAIIGKEVASEQKCALYLVDNFRKLSLVGNTRIEGTAYIPKAGVVRGYINGRSYLGEQLIYGDQKRSGRSLPSLNTDRIEYLKSELLSSNGISSINEKYERSFQDPTLNIHAPTVYLKNHSLSGNIIVRADSLIYIGKEAKLEHVLLFAPNIIIEKGFSGNLQAFASQSIIIEENVQLVYPSTLALLSKNDNENVKLSIADNSLIEGTVLHWADVTNSRYIAVEIAPKVTIEGELIANSKIDFRGIIKGHLSCSGFIYRSPASIFDNHINDATISYPQRFKSYASSNIYQNNSSQNIIKWLKH